MADVVDLGRYRDTGEQAAPVRCKTCGGPHERWRCTKCEWCTERGLSGGEVEHRSFGGECPRGPLPAKGHRCNRCGDPSHTTVFCGNEAKPGPWSRRCSVCGSPRHKRDKCGHRILEQLGPAEGEAFLAVQADLVTTLQHASELAGQYDELHRASVEQMRAREGRPQLAESPTAAGYSFQVRRHVERILGAMARFT